MARPISTETQAIRKLLDERKGEVTFQEASPILTAAGVTVTDLYFNGVKQGWKRLHTPKARKHRVVQVDQKEAIAFVMDNGGLAAVEKDIQRRIGYVRAFKSVLKQAA